MDPVLLHKRPFVQQRARRQWTWYRWRLLSSSCFRGGGLLSLLDHHYYDYYGRNAHAHGRHAPLLVHHQWARGEGFFLSFPKRVHPPPTSGAPYHRCAALIPAPLNRRGRCRSDYGLRSWVIQEPMIGCVFSLSQPVRLGKKMGTKTQRSC